MHQAKDLEMLNEGQYGPRPLRNASDPVFIEEFQCGISTSYLHKFDATSCYHHVIPNSGMLLSRKYGVPIDVTQANAEKLQKADYRK